MTEPISTTQPTFIMAINNGNNQSKAVKVGNISTMEKIADGIALKDNNDRLLGRIETNLSPEAIAKQIGNVIDLQA